ncbi:MAG: BatA domain-containing protein [Chloroflexota bacterium]|nr:BatA domain-containing protein [Chloroflexota bacterium]
MTFISPGFLYAAIAAATMMAALHFLVTRQPRAALLPTARFVPDLPASATSRAARPADILLLLLRMLLILAAGAALAEPILKPSRDPHARVIMADVSESVSDPAAVSDSVRAWYRQGDVLIAFDSSARTIAVTVDDSLFPLTASPVRGNLSAALVSAIRAGSDLRERADSLELVIISPFAAEAWDAATDSIRALWPGRARLVRAGSRADTLVGGNGSMTSRAEPGDPLAVTASLAANGQSSESRLVRDSLTSMDREWSVGEGRVLVSWPAASRPPGAIIRVQRDANRNPSVAGGVVSDSSVVIATFQRRWRFPEDSLAGASVIARWIDGDPAAIERPTGDGCTRSVAIPVTQAGDLVIRPEFIQLTRDLIAPCRADARPPPLAAAKLMSLAGAGGFAPRDAFRTRADVKSVLAPWLFAFALAAAIAELFVRGWGKRGGREGIQS